MTEMIATVAKNLQAYWPTITLWNRLEGRTRAENFDRALKARHLLPDAGQLLDHGLVLRGQLARLHPLRATGEDEENARQDEDHDAGPGEEQPGRDFELPMPPAAGRHYQDREPGLQLGAE